MNTIGVVGLGVVGGAAEAAFRAAGVETRGYDRYRGIGAPADLALCSDGLAAASRGRGYDPRLLDAIAKFNRTIRQEIDPGPLDEQATRKSEVHTHMRNGRMAVGEKEVP